MALWICINVEARLIGKEKGKVILVVERVCGYLGLCIQASCCFRIACYFQVLKSSTQKRRRRYKLNLICAASIQKQSLLFLMSLLSLNCTIGSFVFDIGYWTCKPKSCTHKPACNYKHAYTSYRDRGVVEVICRHWIEYW